MISFRKARGDAEKYGLMDAKMSPEANAPPLRSVKCEQQVAFEAEQAARTSTMKAQQDGWMKAQQAGSSSSPHPPPRFPLLLLACSRAAPTLSASPPRRPARSRAGSWTPPSPPRHQVGGQVGGQCGNGPRSTRSGRSS